MERPVDGSDERSALCRELISSRVKIGLRILGEFLDNFWVDFSEGDIALFDPFVSDERVSVEDDDISSVDGMGVSG